MDEKFENMSLQEKIKMLERIKQLKEAEIKKKEEDLKKEIEELEKRRKKEIEEMEEQSVKEEKTLDEEMMKAMNELLFRERRSYSLSRARSQRRLDFGSEGGDEMSEVFLYNVAESMFSNNPKLKESMSAAGYEKTRGLGASYQSNVVSSLDQYSLESAAKGIQDMNWNEVYQSQESQGGSNMYSSRNSEIDKLDKSLEERRRFF
ncbi:MAG: hypothetical protein ACP5N3_04565 [Candidatus Nanoarchaeia archaeon]